MKRTVEQSAEATVITLADGSKQILAIEEKVCDEGFQLTLSGSLTSDTAYHLQDELDAFISLNKSVKVDFAGVTYISAAAIQSLRNNQRYIDDFRMGKLTLQNVSNEIYEQIDKLGVAELLPIED